MYSQDGKKYTGKDIILLAKTDEQFGKLYDDKVVRTMFIKNSLQTESPAESAWVFSFYIILSLFINLNILRALHETNKTQPIYDNVFLKLKKMRWPGKT